MSKPKSAASFSDKKKTYYMRAAVADLCSRFGHLDTTGLVGPEMREEMLIRKTRRMQGDRNISFKYRQFSSRTVNVRYTWSSCVQSWSLAGHKFAGGLIQLLVQMVF